MGWLRLVGSLKLQVSFVKEPYKRDYILQKRPIILRSLLIIATPYHDSCVSVDVAEAEAGTIDLCAMSHSYVCHDAFMCVPWCIHMCAMAHSCVCHDSIMCVP